LTSAASASENNGEDNDESSGQNNSTMHGKGMGISHAGTLMGSPILRQYNKNRVLTRSEIKGQLSGSAIPNPFNSLSGSADSVEALPARATSNAMRHIVQLRELEHKQRMKKKRMLLLGITSEDSGGIKGGADASVMASTV
jgi:hypothetical protein